jgi:hypothetical protein
MQSLETTHSTAAEKDKEIESYNKGGAERSCVCVCVCEREREGEKERERERARERERGEKENEIYTHT